MSYEDLPANWRALPVSSTPGLAADVVDLTVSVADRESGCLCLIVLDADSRALAPLCVRDVPQDADPAAFDGFLAELQPLVDEVGGALLVARGRVGGILLDDTDRRWHEHLVRTCRRLGMRLEGTYLATPATVRSFPEPWSDQRAS